MSMKVSTRIELIDPNDENEEPLIKLTVPGEITPEQIKKDIRVSVSLKIDLGNKIKRKSAEVEIIDDEIKRKLEEYVNNLTLRIFAMNTSEEIRGEYKLQDIKSD